LQRLEQKIASLRGQISTVASKREMQNPLAILSGDLQSPEGTLEHNPGRKAPPKPIFSAPESELEAAGARVSAGKAR